MLKPSTGGSSRQHFYELASQSGWADWKGRIRILQEEPYFFTHHVVPINGRTWFFYCLGSPKDGAAGAEEYRLDPTGVDQCRSLQVPVGAVDGSTAMRPLHDADDGGQTMWHLYVWDWDNHAVKVLSHRLDSSMHRALYGLVEREETLMGYDILLECVPQGNMFKYEAHRSVRGFGDFESEAMPLIQEQMATGEIQAAYNPVVTYEALQQRIAQATEGAGAQERPQTTDPLAELDQAPNIFESGTTPPPTRFDPEALLQGQQPESKPEQQNDVLKGLLGS